MIIHIPQSKLYTSDHGWLQSKFLFSFADYFDQENIEWGSLRVFNDDTIAPHSGFPMHSHKEMEIVTIMLAGTLTHTDSMGNLREISQGDVQHMSAGTGITHSEINNGDSPVSLFQVWMYPSERDQPPAYTERTYKHLTTEGVHVLGTEHGEGESIALHSPSKLLYGNLPQNKEEDLLFTSTEKVLIYVKKGEFTLGELVAKEGDQLRITEQENIHISVTKDTEFVMIISTTYDL